MDYEFEESVFRKVMASSTIHTGPGNKAVGFWVFAEFNKLLGILKDVKDDKTKLAIEAGILWDESTEGMKDSFKKVAKRIRENGRQRK